MPRLSMIPTLIREVFGEYQFPREPEPALIMEDEYQVNAYSEAGRIDGVMAAAYLFQTARITQTIKGSKRVIDLGCGPATQLAQIAQINPDIHFTGVDLSCKMLEDAERHIHDLGLKNIEFIESDISQLSNVGDASFDAVISTMALHHLPNINSLKSSFLEIKRILKPGGAIYLTDFSRLKSLKSVLFFAYLNKDFQPASFSLDYERSLRAAFLRSNFIDLAKQIFSDQVEIYNTFGIPILLVIKTPDAKISPEIINTLKQMRKQLQPKYRRELDDIRFLFWLSGLKNDPF